MALSCGYFHCDGARCPGRFRLSMHSLQHHLNRVMSRPRENVSPLDFSRMRDLGSLLRQWAAGKYQENSCNPGNLKKGIEEDFTLLQHYLSGEVIGVKLRALADFLQRFAGTIESDETSEGEFQNDSAEAHVLSWLLTTLVYGATISNPGRGWHIRIDDAVMQIPEKVRSDLVERQTRSAAAVAGT